MHIGRINILRGKAEKRQQVRAVAVKLLFGQSKPVAAEIIAECPAAKGVANIKSFGQGALNQAKLMGAKAAFFQAVVIDALSAFQCPVAERIGNDVLALFFRIAKSCKRAWDRAIDNFEVSAAGQLFKFNQCKVRLYACGVAIH